MSEYNANDHLHNVTESVMQLTRQAQGVQDITGANVSDYEQISPDAAASVTLYNARQNVPFLVLVNTLPPVQPGTGTPSLANVRPLTKYTRSVIINGDAGEYSVVLPDDFYGGEVDFIGKQLKSDIIRVRIESNFNWTDQGVVEGVYLAADTQIPEFSIDAANRYVSGENIYSRFVSASANLTDGTLGLFSSGYGRIFIRPDPSWNIASIDDLKTWLDNNPIYIYYRVAAPVGQPIDTTIPYVQDSNYTVSAESGTLTVKYQGIAPDEP